MSRQVVVVTEECMGCEACVSMCPDVFGFDDDKGVAFIKDPYGADEEAIEEAIDSCPASCIHWDAN